MAARILPFAVLAAGVSAMSFPRALPAPPGVLAFPVHQERSEVPITKLKKRLIDTDVPVLNVTSTSYLIELNIGTPAQTVKVAIDTGSSELWVNPNCDGAGATAQQDTCLKNGKYNPARSSTAEITSEEGHITYGKGEVVFEYVTDNLALPGSDIKLSAVQFGHGTDSVDLTMGILGLSFGSGYNLNYLTVVEELKKQTITKTLAFGVALGDKDEKSNSGLISFGGIDTKKFSGNLHSSPILGPQGKEDLYRYWVQLNSVGLTQGSNAKTYPSSGYPVFFDTGATLSYMPSAVLKAIVADLKGALDSETQLYKVPCSTDGSVDFTFGDYTLKVPFSEFIWTLIPDFCVLGADIATDGSYILGDSFLRAAYVVFDMDTPALHFAAYENCGTNLQEIPVGKNATSKFVGECAAPKAADKPNPAGRISPVSGAWFAAGALAAVQVGMSLL